MVSLENSYRLNLTNELEKHRDKLEKSVKLLLKLLQKREKHMHGKVSLEEHHIYL